jgi:predicted PurR-regulated permease PerM
MAVSEREEAVSEGRARPKPIPTVVVDENAEPIDRLRMLSVWSEASIALVAVGAALFFMRDLFLPIATAFVVGVMLSPVAKALEQRRIPRVVSAALIVLLTALLIALVVALIASPVAQLAERLPAIGEKLRAFDGVLGFWRRIQATIGITGGNAGLAVPEPSISWLPTTLGFVTPPLTGFLYFLVVLLLFISWWPDLRRQLVMTFADRDSRLRVLKILNEVEDSLAAYLVTVASINLAVGVAAGAIAFVTGLPTPIGFGALAATLNFIPIVGPIATIVVLAAVGVVTGTTLWMGLLPAALFMLVVFVEGQFITPSIIGRRIEINALAVLLSLMFWTWMWGPMGAFLSSPLLIVGLILHQHLSPEQRS